MSDVVVSVVESTTTVTVTDQDVAVAITESPVVVTTGTSALRVLRVILALLTR